MEKRMQAVSLKQLIPYENNPRLNENAIEAVKASIEQCGYVAPIIVDEDYVILAGHTRYAALVQENGEEAQVDVIVCYGMSEEQKRKYRLLDNKTNEFAAWDFDKLKEELEDLDFGEFDFGFTFGADDGYVDDFFDDGVQAKDKEQKADYPCKIVIEVETQYDEAEICGILEDHEIKFEVVR